LNTVSRAGEFIFRAFCDLRAFCGGSVTDHFIEVESRPTSQQYWQNQGQSRSAFDFGHRPEAASNDVRE
jgi:hypothetical protein